MVRSVRITACACLLAAQPVLAATGVWRNYTSMKDVRGVVSVGTAAWAATSGGLFAWDRTTGGFGTYTSAEGLKSVDLTAVAVDLNGSVWSGSSGGILHVLPTNSASFRYVTDIAQANQTAKRINALVVAGDTLLICSDFGLSLFRVSRFEFGDTYSKFGDLPSTRRYAVSSAAIHDGKLWAAISDEQSLHRVVFASLSNPNILPPEAWTVTLVGPQGLRARGLAAAGGRLFAATTAGVYVSSGTAWQEVSGTAGKAFTGITASGTDILAVALTDSQTYRIDPGLAVTPLGATLPFPPTCIAADGRGEPLVGSLDGGVLTGTQSWNSLLPNGPASNQFVSVTIDRDGNVWGASGRDPGFGFYRYDGSRWISYTRRNAPLGTNAFYRVSTGCDGTVWVSGYGTGVIEFPPGATVIDTALIHSTDVGMVGVPSNPVFVVPSTVACDGQGNTWMSVIYPANRRVLSVRSRTGAWRHLPVSLQSGSSEFTFLMDNPVDRCLAVDAFDNLWAVSRDPVYRGVVGLGNRGALDSTAAFLLTAQNGLPSNDVNTVVVDRDNDLWIGTDRGIAIVLDPSNPLRPGGIASYRPLSATVVNTIAVDALNRKWVGTNLGVVVLSPDGTQTLEEYTVANTDGRLIDNDVKSIAVDDRTGTVYFASQLGLASLTTAAAAPVASFDVLTVSPNPYLLPSTAPVTIDGLVENSSIKILTIGGRLVRELDTPGGRIGFWDGRDDRGELVPSGVYLIVAFPESGEQTATGKIAVIRR